MNTSIQTGMLLLAKIPEGFDLSRKVPTLTIACMVISMILMLALPVGYIIFIKRKMDMDFNKMIIGIAAYILSGIILYNAALFVLVIIPGVKDYLNANVILTNMIAAVIASVLAIAGIFFGMKFMDRKELNLKNAAMFVFGFVGLVIIISNVADMITLVINSVTINSQGLEVILNGIEDSNVNQTVEACNHLLNTNSFQFLLYGVDSIVVFLIRVMESILIYAVIKKKSSAKLIVIAFGMEIVYNTALILFSVGVLPSQWIGELINFAVVIAAGILIKKLFTETLTEEWAILTTKKPEKKQITKMPKINMPK